MNLSVRVSLGDGMSEFIVLKDHGFFEVSNCAGSTYGVFNLEVTAQRLRDQLNAGLAAQAEIERLRAKVAELAECVKMAAELQDSDLIDFGAYGLTCDSDIAKKYRAALEGLSDEFEVPDELGVML